MSDLFNKKFKCYSTILVPLVEAVSSFQNNKAVRQVGIEWCIEQSKELLEANVPVLHYYSMGKSDNIKAIFSALK